MKTQITQIKPAGPRITSTSAGLLIRLKTYRAAVLALFFAGATLLSTSAASADTITVININDSGPGSLRQALVDTNDGDTINFDSSLNGQRITLTGELKVDKDVTISGPGANHLAVDGNAQSRVFYVNPGKTVTIDGLTVANGHLFSGNGGGIYNDAAALTVTNCVLTGNSAGGYGGGIYNNAGALTVTNCTFSGNGTVSYGGGGIYNDAGAVTVTNCMLSRNFAWSGGGISNEDGAVTVSNCTFSGNDAYSAGGGIFNIAFHDDASLTVTNCTISGNSVGKGEGGGIFNYGYGGGANLTITNSTISGNDVFGIYNVGGGRQSKPEIQSSTAIWSKTFPITPARLPRSDTT